MSESSPNRFRPYRQAVISVILVVGGIVGGTYAQLGAVEGLRAATALVMPLSLVWLLVLAAGVWWLFRRQLTLGMIHLAIWALMTVSFNTHVANWVIGPLEKQAGTPDPSAKINAVVVLGGGVSVNPGRDPELNGEGQRVMTAAQLWHSGRTGAIICTGERPGVGDNQSESARSILRSVGVPDDVIFEIGGENTSQEMQNLSEFMQTPPERFTDDGVVALITSAFHMPRAMRLAGKNGLELMPLPCCFRNRPPNQLSPDQLIPSLEAGIELRIAIKEHLAGLVGR